MTSSTVSDRAKCSPWSLSQGLVVTLWDTRSERYLRFPSTQRIHSWTSVQVSVSLSSQQSQPHAILISDRLEVGAGAVYKLQTQLNSSHLIYFLVVIQELKSKVTEELGYPAASQRLYMCNQELEEHLEMKDLASSLCLDPFQMSQLGKSLFPVCFLLLSVKA